LPHVAGYEFDAIYEAGKTEALVGGDWYDVFLLADGRFVISIGDVAGSGLIAAVLMAGVRQAIRGAAHVRPEPSMMLAAADRALDDPMERFATAFVGVIDPQTSTLTYQSAGHPPPMLRRPDGTVGELAGGGPPLGLYAQYDPPPPHTLDLPHESLLVLFTDGLTESTRDVFAGEERLRAALRDATCFAAERPARRLHDCVLADGSHDDVAILTVRVL
jgi:serine phosphatase RsbU (regulator of sigma subunit)